MPSDLIVVIALGCLVMLSVGGIAYAVMARDIESEGLAKRRLDAIVDREQIALEKRAAAELAGRKKNISNALKELETRQRSRAQMVTAPTMTLRLQQAGLSWNLRTFIMVSVIVGCIGFIIPMVLGRGLLISAGVSTITGFGLPRWYIARRRKKRMLAFINELPNAVDVIVRGIRSGLPLGDCLRIIAQEAKEPVRSEFRYIVEAQTLGVTVGDACMKLYEHIPVQEANFFGIVIAIQQKAGGNLSETLSNLSRVLRERKKMAAKIRAVSQEAKASAAIIGALPVLVASLVSIVSPKYLLPLIENSTGNMLLVISAAMMFMGVMIMRKMINFDF